MSDEIKEGKQPTAEQSAEMDGRAKYEEPDAEGQTSGFRVRCWRCGAIGNQYSVCAYCWYCGARVCI